MPKGVSSYPDRHGKLRYRYRSKNLDYAFKSPFGTPEFEKEYQACLLGNKPNIGVENVRPGSMKALAALYYRSSWFLDLADSTKANYRNIIERFLKRKVNGKLYGDLLVTGLERKHLQRILSAMADTPHAANNLLKKLRILLAYAVEIGMRNDNPATGIRLYRTKSKGHHSWSEAEIAQYESKHPLGTKARLALDLLLHTAQRRSDVVKMGRQHLKANMIRVRQVKSGEMIELWLPVSPAFAATLPKNNMTFLMGEHGKPYSAKGFGARFKKWCVEAGLKHCSAHGLRKASARRLAEAGCTPHQIASMTGHKTLSEVEHYTRAAEQIKLAQQATENLSNRRAGLDKKSK